MSFVLRGTCIEGCSLSPTVSRLCHFDYCYKYIQLISLMSVIRQAAGGCGKWGRKREEGRQRVLFLFLVLWYIRQNSFSSSSFYVESNDSRGDSGWELVATINSRSCLLQCDPLVVYHVECSVVKHVRRSSASHWPKHICRKSCFQLNGDTSKIII
jgi:hypothetical protein